MRFDATLSYSKSFHFLKYLLAERNAVYDIDLEKNKITLYNHHHKPLYTFFVPLTYNLKKKTNIGTESISFQHKRADYFIILIQAGQSAIAHVQNEKLLRHKVIRKYMVRKKQGKAQISYLKTKGKSRAGSRIRLANSVSFFEEINNYVNSLFRETRPETILYYCTPVLWGRLFNSKIKPSFDKKDPLLQKVPLDIARPALKQLKRVVIYAEHGYLSFHDECPMAERIKIIQTIATF